jgi:uracil-DNA glycosylase
METIIPSNKDVFINWKQKFPKKCNIRELLINDKWNDFWEIIEKAGLDDYLNRILDKDKDRFELVPPPELMFYSKNRLAPKDIKIIVLGQDPYPRLPDAQGASFSVPYGVEIPSSLNNIYKNMIKNGNMNKKPKHGCLVPWIAQGVFLVNSAYTTRDGMSNYHQQDWTGFTKKLLEFLNSECDNLVFLIWGGFADKAIKNAKIDETRHKTSISSHPSGFSVNNTYGTHPSFADSNHFNYANKQLKKFGKTQILWDCLDIIDEIFI